MVRTAGPNSQFGRRRRVRQCDCKRRHEQLLIVTEQRVLAERSQIAQFFQWLPRSRQTREGKVRVAGLVPGPGLRLEAVMRRMLIVTAVAAAISLSLRASQAYERPWCALTDIGGGVMHENCTIPTFEMCVREVIAGNRGFCNPNPRWQGPRPRGPGDRSPAKARRLLRNAVRTPANESGHAEIVRGWVPCRERMRRR